jgi:hypothetical protein
MLRLEGPGSAMRLRSLQARFRAIRGRAERRNALRSAKPVVRDFGLYFVAFVTVGAVVWWLMV